VALPRPQSEHAADRYEDGSRQMGLQRAGDQERPHHRADHE
jgi:hypothetical protein